MDSNLNINKQNKFEFKIEPSNESNIKEDLDIKWKEIEEFTKEKINTNKESRKLNNLNNYAIMRINLNSLIHPIDDSSEFENYCNLKLRQLDKVLNSLENNSKINPNLVTFSSNIIERKFQKNDNDNNIKSFLKSDNDIDIENQFFSRYTLDEIVEINKKKKNKKKVDLNKLFDNNNSNNNTQDINTNKTFTYNSKNKFEYEEDTYDKKLDRFANKLNEIKNTFLKRDINLKSTDNNLLSTKERNSFNKYKNNFQKEFIFSGYKTSKNKTINNDRINNNIKEGYNYLYNLYHKLKKNNQIK